jgi:serine/threonine-protein kinase
VAAVGRGTSGRVFRAEGPNGQRCAVKVLEPMLDADAVARQRFAHEVRSARLILHPNVVPIVDSGEDAGRPFLVMPWYPNGSLADELSFVGPLAAARLATLALDMGAGLEAVHARELVHRDVKTANVLVGGDGHFVVGDLGLARGPAYTRLTVPGDVPGTTDYVAPERLLGGPATPASDVYAFACVLFECVTGQPPFGGSRSWDVVRAHIETSPPDPLVTRGDLPAAVGPAILAGLAKDPAERMVGAEALGRRVAAALGRPLA